MNKWSARSLARILSAGLILALLIPLSGFASTEPRDVTASFDEVAKLIASDGAAFDLFGESVSINGDTVVVGAFGDDDDGDASGSAYVFQRDAGGPGNWGEVAKLTASDGIEGDMFGDAVSISENTVVIGTPAILNDSSAGSAYLFEKPESGWTDMIETAKLTASDGAVGDWFGISVSISDNTVVIGATENDGNTSDSGSAYVFEKPESGWVDMTETAKLTASDGAADDSFGISVSISGNTVVIGANENNGNASDSGSAYVFERPESGWVDMTETAKLTASDGASMDNFGLSVSMDGSGVIVGAPYDDDRGAYSGSAYLFEEPESGWTNLTEAAKLTASDGVEGDEFGTSVSIDDDTVIVGAREDDDAGDESGSAYLFEKPEAGWSDMVETAKFTASDAAAGDYFGVSVSISNATVVVGAWHDYAVGFFSGSAYVFHGFRPVTWVYLPVVLRSY